MLLNSLPRYLQLAFPAVLSRKSELSHRVIDQLCVGNQHKMGPAAGHEPNGLSATMMLVNCDRIKGINKFFSEKL